MPKAKKNMTPAEKAAARVPEQPPAAEEAPAPAPAAPPDKGERRRRLALLVGGLVLLVLLSFTLWTCDYSHETDVARASLSSTQQTAVSDEPGWIAFGDPSARTGLVFYPGGKVAAEAYAPLMRQLADTGMFCVIAKMPFNLAFLDNAAAERVMAAYSEVGSWYLGGHSLGGVAACQWAAAHPDRVEGLVLLASYTPDDLSGTGLRVLSVHGTDDGVMDGDAYGQARQLLPAGAREVVIEGGNHAQFGEYGEQAGDGVASIDAAEQRDRTVQAITDWLQAA